MPKDFFKQYVNEQSQHEQNELEQFNKVFSSSYEVKPWQLVLANTISNTALSFLTSPLTVLHTHLQLSTKNRVAINNLHLIMEAKIPIKDQRRLELLLHNNSLPYEAQSYQNYRSAWRGIAEQGLLGFYKGFGSGLFHLVLNGQLRYFAIQRITTKNMNKLQQMGITAAIASVMDVLTNPLQLIQSRMILQNRLPNYRTYESIGQLLKSKDVRQFQLVPHLTKNATLFLCQLPSYFISQERISLIYLLAIQQIVTYPFLTVIRRLHCQSQDLWMLRGNRDFLETLRESGGIRQLYRGFGAYALASTFVSLVLYSTQLLGENFDD